VLFRLVIKVEKKGSNMNSNLKPIPVFNTEDEEREFWATHDFTDYVDMSQAVKNPFMPNLKPSSRTVSIRLPEYLIAALKILANKKDIPYQSLMKMYLSEKVNEETNRDIHEHA
jgi:predicted DNA binding CopG/RHH family protein